MNNIYVNKLDREFELHICKVNKDIVGTVPVECINSINRSMVDMDKIEFSIKKYIYSNGTKILNPLWSHCKNERLACLNDKEYFVLKVNDFASNDNVKRITAYSREYKLGKLDIKVEDIGFHLLDKDEESGIYSLNDYMKIETGWSFGHIDDSVLYDVDSEGNKTEKLRWQESINKRWYDFIKTDVCESFGAIAVYDTVNKLINLYDISSFGENLELYLSNDNYIKDLQRTKSSEDIVTRLYLVGNEEMDIIGATVTGYPYIEDFSYFIENDEMSLKLKNNLIKYYDMVEIRKVIWENLISEKQSKLNILTPKKMDLYIIFEEIRAKISIKESYASNGDTVNEAIVAAEITKLRDEQTVLEVEIKNLEDDIVLLNESILEINILCKRETATDENGKLIFDEDTLEELKEFIYCDTYTNDSFLRVEDLLAAGKRELSLRCKPTVDYRPDLKNFMKNVNSNGFNKHWNGDLGLGDIVILYDEDEEVEVPLFLNGYTQYPNDVDKIDLEMSNKKIADSNLRIMQDRIKEAELTSKMLSRKLHLLNKQKYNRMNLERENMSGEI